MLAVQNNLFDIPAQEVKTRRQILIERRTRAEKAVYAHQSELWKESVLHYAERYFLPNNSSLFLAQDLRQSYDIYAREQGKPVTAQSKAFAGIFTALRKARLIEVCGVGKRENKVLAITYRSLL